MASTLSATQLATLLDTLTHGETYSEIRDFRDPASLEHYGPPFTSSGKPSRSPALQALLTRFLLAVPGIRDLPEAWWKVQMSDVIQDLTRANLSESYDKGSVGSRKTVTTALSALLEYPVRGVYAGFEKVEQPQASYDQADPDSLSTAFRDFMSDCIYGDALDRLVQRTAETIDLAQHEPSTQAVHEFMLINTASMMHFSLVLAPKGQYLLKLAENANKLVPYAIIKQTLKIGNVATMINAMMRVVLAKMSVATVTNWIGLTASPNTGPNLMQYIISTVLNWDNKDMESRASKIDKDNSPPTKDQLVALKAYTSLGRQEQERIRDQSEKGPMSIVTAILKDAGKSTKLSEEEHRRALEYLNCHLSVRDRKEIVHVLCNRHPDHLTEMVRRGAAAYEPVIRGVHNAVNLSDTVTDVEAFVKDVLKVGRIQPGHIPTVGDFVQLLKKHSGSSHKFLHRCCKNGPELTSWYLEWLKKCASHFRRQDMNPELGAGNLTEPLTKMFTALPAEQKQAILQILDAQSEHIDDMHEASRTRLGEVLKSPASKNPAITTSILLRSGRSSSRSSSQGPSRSRSKEPSRAASPPDDEVLKEPLVRGGPGPGAYISRWQDLIDTTAITPLEPEGVKTEIRNGRQTPDVRPVLDAFSKEFRMLLAQRSCDW